MKIALAQINPVLGAFETNAQKIIEFCERAHLMNADIVVFPEASLFGYHPMDLLELPWIVKEQEKYIQWIHKRIPKGLGVFIGAITENPKKTGKLFWNSTLFLLHGQKPKVFGKQLLPNYDVFDEDRHIEPSETKNNFFTYKGYKILVTICEDIWGWSFPGAPRFSFHGSNPLFALKGKKVDFVVNMSASPYTKMKYRNRNKVVKATATHFKAPMVYVNMVGAQDELIFDGGSFAVNAKGKTVAQLSRFTEEIAIFDLEKEKGQVEKIEDSFKDLHKALVVGIRDFVHKSGFQKIILGLSGGVDSAVVACLAAEAVGSENVTTVMLPGPFTSRLSVVLAEQLAKKLKTRHINIPINEAYQVMLAGLEKKSGIKEFGLMNENLQARIRGVNLMALANQEGALLMGCSNKSELAVGYSTLYGDLCGALLPIGDLLKTEVYKLADAINDELGLIPEEILTRAPTAELRLNQKDQDSLPPYEQLDKVVTNLIEHFKKPTNELEKKTFQLNLKSEFKRWQSAPILKVSDHAFGRGRRFPVAHQFR